MQAKPTFTLGTAVKITTTLSMSSPDSVKITIKDPAMNTVVTSQDCVREADKIYSYIYQSLEDGQEGTYLIKIAATYGQYTARSTDTFELNDDDEDWENGVGDGAV